MQVRYFNIIHASHLPIWLSEGYKANSKRLDLENTRSLLPYEEPVECKEGMMVFDICNALFSIYELVDGDGDAELGYHEHPRRSEGDRKVLVAVNVNGDENGEVAREVLDNVVREMEEMGQGKVYASLYEHKGEEAQPAMHPRIDERDVGGGKWLGLVAILGKEGVEVEKIRKVVDERVGKKKGVKIGVWEEEVDVGQGVVR
jgi:hypothetical protein